MASPSPSAVAAPIPLRFNLAELAGSLGDLGTLLPLAAALITVNHMDATGVFFTFGVAYVTAGLYYRLPIPVQPLKAVAAIAIATGLSGKVVSAAGPVLGVILLLLAASGPAVGRLFAKPLVRGIQLGLGLLLVQTGLLLAARPQLVFAGTESVVYLGEIGIPLGLPIATVVGLVLLRRRRTWRLPAMLLALGLPSLHDLGLAAALLVVPQIPLTLANSVVATQRTAEDYFGQSARKVSYRALLASMGCLNLAAGFLGGLPVCHGSGGLTAHYRFGARTGGANLLIGGGLAALAIFVDGNVVPLLALIPYPVLGALLVFTGVQHGMLARDVRGWREVLLVGAVATVGFATGNLALGFGLGLLLQGVLRLSEQALGYRPPVSR